MLYPIAELDYDINQELKSEKAVSIRVPGASIDKVSIETFSNSQFEARKQTQAYKFYQIKTQQNTPIKVLLLEQHNNYGVLVFYKDPTTEVQHYICIHFGNMSTDILQGRLKNYRALLIDNFVK